MDWFQRYGIPGAYLLAMTFAWLYVGHSCWPVNLDADKLIAVGAFLFLPLGYLVSISTQLYYLLRPQGGLHRAAANRINVTVPGETNNIQAREPDLEAISCLTAALGQKLPLDSERHIQEWIRKRMDVIVMNRGLEVGTFVAGFVGLLLLLLGVVSFQPNWCLIGSLFILSVIMVAIARWVRRTIEEQITVVISGVFLARAESQNSFVLGAWRPDLIDRYPQLPTKFFRFFSNVRRRFFRRSEQT